MVEEIEYISLKRGKIDPVLHNDYGIIEELKMPILRGRGKYMIIETPNGKEYIITTLNMISTRWQAHYKEEDILW